MHAACISDIDTDKRIISVEWTEGKDTKGKEVRTYMYNIHTYDPSFTICCRLILISYLL